MNNIFNNFNDLNNLRISRDNMSESLDIFQVLASDAIRNNNRSWSDIGFLGLSAALVAVRSLEYGIKANKFLKETSLIDSAKTKNNLPTRKTKSLRLLA